MAHCLIWFNDISHMELDLDAVPKQGESMQIEDDDGVMNFVVTSVEHSLTRHGQKWTQLIDIFLKPRENPDIPW